MSQTNDRKWILREAVTTILELSIKCPACGRNMLPTYAMFAPIAECQMEYSCGEHSFREEYHDITRIPKP
jgi:hypothetical protein